MTDDNKALIKVLLSSQEGRKLLAERMVSPFRCGGISFDEHGRRIFRNGKLVDPLDKP